MLVLTSYEKHALTYVDVTSPPTFETHGYGRTTTLIIARQFLVATLITPAISDLSPHLMFLSCFSHLMFNNLSKPTGPE